jgi:hypothetical protein
MPSLIDNDVDHRAIAEQQFPVTDLVRTYLEQTGSKFLTVRDARREAADPATAQDLWDYLGDFA